MAVKRLSILALVIVLVFIVGYYAGGLNKNTVSGTSEIAASGITKPACPGKDCLLELKNKRLVKEKKTKVVAALDQAPEKPLIIYNDWVEPEEAQRQQLKIAEFYNQKPSRTLKSIEARRYHNTLSPGLRALFEAYPDTFAMPLYRAESFDCDLEVCQIRQLAWQALLEQKHAVCGSSFDNCIGADVGLELSQLDALRAYNSLQADYDKAGLLSWDGYLGRFAGQFDNEKWRIIGERTLYLPFHNYRFDHPNWDYNELLSKHHINPNAMRYEKRKSYILEAQYPVTSLNKQQVYKRFYFDSESGVLTMVEFYNEDYKLDRLMLLNSIFEPGIGAYINRALVVYDMGTKQYLAAKLINKTDGLVFNKAE